MTSHFRTTKCRFYDYSLIEWGPELGGGQFGVVYRAVLLDNNARWEVAIKKAKARATSNVSIESNNEGEMVTIERTQQDLASSA
jgi:hypothetical protein